MNENTKKFESDENSAREERKFSTFSVKKI